MFNEKIQHLLQSLDEAHTVYYQSEVFGGPSLHFHLRALQASQDQDFENFVESTYATLTAWGMHRMGSGGPKMTEFEEFKQSIARVWEIILELQEVQPENLVQHDWSNLERVFCDVRCTKTGTALVGNSKVMAHALPNLLVPVDREYTLQFLFGNKRVVANLEWEWKKLHSILQDFFYQILEAERFKVKLEEWQQNAEKFRWDTSPLKVIDNLVIGLERARKLQTKSKG